MTDENVLIVQADSAETSLASARLGTRRWRCTLGAGGIREDKVERIASSDEQELLAYFGLKP